MGRIWGSGFRVQGSCVRVVLKVLVKGLLGIMLTPE